MAGETANETRPSARVNTYDVVNAGPNDRFMVNGRIVSNSGRLLQLQNLPQNHIETLDEARELVKMGCFDMVESIYGNTPDILSQLVRTMLIPKEGCEFLVADFSAIEARVLAWEAGEQWRLEAFENGEDIYCSSASKMFHVPVVKHGINGDLRQKGKVAELACIARGSLVLTDKGEIPIQYVTKDQRIWDGRHWVKHGGVVFKGFRPIIHYDGLSATEEHLVYVETQSDPIEFGEAVRRRLPLRKKNRKGYVPDFYRGFTPVYDILNAGPKHRFTVSGCLVHNCGYGGGTGALIKMGALDMGLEESELPDLINDWRKSNPNIVQYWWDVEAAAVDTLKTGLTNKVRKIKFSYSDRTLWMHLPSGRKLAYINPKLQANQFGRLSITYMGIGNNNKWERLETYAGKLVENCIGKGTLVLTSRGLIPIEDIRPDDRIWDGEDWVEHDGLSDKGFQKTVSVNGIHMTPEHKVLTEKGWMKNVEAEGFNWAAVSLPDGFGTSRKRQVRKNSVAMPVCMWGRADLCSKRFDKEKVSCEILRMHEEHTDQRVPETAWDEPSSCVWSLAFYEAAVRGSKSPGLSQLWRARHHSLPGVEQKFRIVLAGHGPNISERLGAGSYRQQSRVLSKQLSMGNTQGKLQKQANKSCNRDSLWPDDCFRIIGTDRNWRDDASVSSGSSMADRITVRSTGLSEQVYDIRNCGPRHRFAVYDQHAGKYRIVSNCTQAIARDILAEAMYRMEQAGLEIVGSIHDEAIIEAPIGKYTVEEVCDLMTVRPSWCADMPITADGFKSNYYKKD